MTYRIEYYGDYQQHQDRRVYGDCHGVIEVEAEQLDDAEDRAARRLREIFGEAFTIAGCAGLSAWCL